MKRREWLKLLFCAPLALLSKPAKAERAVILQGSTWGCESTIPMHGRYESEKANLCNMQQAL